MSRILVPFLARHNVKPLVRVPRGISRFELLPLAGSRRQRVRDFARSGLRKLEPFVTVSLTRKKSNPSAFGATRPKIRTLRTRLAHPQKVEPFCRWERQKTNRTQVDQNRRCFNSRCESKRHFWNTGELRNFELGLRLRKFEPFVAVSPTRIDESPTSQPPITLPSPSVNLKVLPRARDESKTLPPSTSRPS